MAKSGLSLRAKLLGSLQGQLQVSSVLVLFAGFTAASCGSLWIDQRNLSEARSRALHERAETIHICIAQLIAGSPNRHGAAADHKQALPPLTQSQLTQLPVCLQGRRDSDSAFVLQLGDGQLVRPSPESRLVSNSTIEELINSLEARANPTSDLTLQRKGIYYLVHRHSPSNTGPQLIAVENLNERARHFSGSLVAFMVIWMVLLACTAAAVSVVVRRALAPLRHLGNIADSITAETLPSTRLQLKNAPAEITELARSYDKLLDRLSETWANQKQFVSAVSHELRNPLTLVSGYIRRTLRRGDNLRDDQRKGLGIAEDETNRIIRLIAQLLDLSRSDNGTLKVEVEPVRLANELQEVANLARTALNRPFQLELPVGPSDRALCVPANSDRLRQVVMNLIENADKYSPAQAPVQVKLSREGQTMVIQVVDQGIGIPEQDLEHVFERFYRAGNTSAVEGSGMGLAVAKVLVDSMGGTISVNSTVGEGTTFSLAFPLVSNTPAPISTTSPSPEPSAIAAV